MTKLKKILDINLWDIKIENYNKFIRGSIKTIRLIFSTAVSYKKDDIPLRASSLTLYTMLSVIPLVAIVFGIAKGFGIEKSLQSFLFEKFSNQQEVLEYVLQFAQNMLDHTKGGFIAGIGLIILFWTVLKVLSDIELSFNAIWGVKKARSWSRKFADYFSILLLAPVLILLSSSANVYITTSVSNLAERISLLGFFSPLIFFLLKCIPYLLVWILFSLLYAIIPNTRVNIKSAILAGIIAGTIFQITQWGYIHFQIGVSRYNSIYGTFAAFPLFLIWLNTSWIIVLLGTVFSVNHQNKYHLTSNTEFSKLSWSNRRIAMILILTHIINNFLANKRPIGQSKLAKKLEIDENILSECAELLLNMGLLSKIERKKSYDKFYIPTFDLSELTIEEAIQKIDSHGLRKEFGQNDKILSSIKETISKLDIEKNKLEFNKRLRDI